MYSRVAISRIADGRALGSRCHVATPRIDFFRDPDLFGRMAVRCPRAAREEAAGMPGVPATRGSFTGNTYASPGVNLPDNAGSAVPRNECEGERPTDLVRHAVASLTAAYRPPFSRFDDVQKGSITDRGSSRRESMRKKERRKERRWLDVNLLASSFPRITHPDPGPIKPGCSPILF